MISIRIEHKYTNLFWFTIFRSKLVWKQVSANRMKPKTQKRLNEIMFNKIKSKYKAYTEARFQSWTGLAPGEITVYRANRFLVFLLMSGLTGLAVYGYSFYPKLASLLSDGFLFFHFPKIFNLKVPEPIFFTQMA